jgi:hypothetical protein
MKIAERTATWRRERRVLLRMSRAAGWPAPEDPDFDDDAELDGRDTIADRLADEAGWLRQCSGWLTRLHADDYPPAVNLRPGGDHPSRALVVTGLPGWPRSWTASPPASMSLPGPGGSRT